MSWREDVFEVPNNGVVLRGIITRPNTGSCDMAVILLPAGLKDRVGPHRLYVQLARQLVRPGVLVLRLDAEGIGESDGELDTAINARHYRRIQSGLFVDDTLSAMRALTAREGVRRFVLGGLCGGAISAQLAAAAAPSVVAGILSLSHVAVLDEDRLTSTRTRSEVVSNNRAYLRKLFPCTPGGDWLPAKANGLRSGKTSPGSGTCCWRRPVLVVVTGQTRIRHSLPRFASCSTPA